MKNKSSKALQATAYHEAGHAVISLLQDLKITSISIVSTDESFGHITHEDVFKNLKLSWADEERELFNNRLEKKEISGKLKEFLEEQLTITENIRGEEVLSHEVTEAAREIAEKNTMIALAGCIAEEKHILHSDNGWEGGDQDRHDAFGILHAIYGSNAQEEALRIEIRTKQQVESAWPLFEKLANVLLEHKTLTEQEIRELLPETRSVKKYE